MILSLGQFLGQCHHPTSLHSKASHTVHCTNTAEELQRDGREEAGMAGRHHHTVGTSDEMEEERDLISEIFYRQTVPMSADAFWSDALKDPIALLECNEAMEDLRITNVPAGGRVGDVGTGFTFYTRRGDDYKDKVETTIAEKDEGQRRLTFENVPSFVFKKVQVSFQVIEVDQDTAMYVLKFQIVSFNEKIKERTEPYMSGRGLPVFVHDVMNMVARKNGGQHQVEFDINCGTETLWRILSNIRDVSWLQNTTLVKVDEKSRRRTIEVQGNKQAEEELVLVDHDDHTFISVIQDADVTGVQYLRTQIVLEAVNPYVTRLKYRSSFLPETGKESVKRLMDVRTTFLKGKYGIQEPQSLTRAPTFDEVWNRRGKHTVTVGGTISEPVEEVWEAFRPFGPESMQFWPQIKSLVLDPPGKDEVGSVRTVLYDTTSRRERLEERDDIKHVMVYSMLPGTMHPNIFKTYSEVTMVTMEEVLSSNDGTYETVVKFECFLDGKPRYPLNIEKEARNTFYTGVIKNLRKYMKVEVGKLKVNLQRAINLKDVGTEDDPCPDPYVVMLVNDAAKPEVSTVCSDMQKPVWNQQFVFPLTHTSQTLYFTIMDKNYDGSPDTVMGTTEVDISTLQSGEERQMDLPVDEGGTLKVTLKLAMHGHPLSPQEQVMNFKKTWNNLLGELQALAAELEQVLQNFAVGGNIYEMDTYKNLKSNPGIKLKKLPGFAKGLPVDQFPHADKVARAVGRLMTFVSQQARILLRQKAELEKGNQWGLYESFFGQILLAPEKIIATWRDDGEFTRQYIQGMNPVMLRVCQSVQEIPIALVGLKGQGKTVLELIDERRLFIVDYNILREIPQQAGKHFYAPTLLMYREKLEDGKSRLSILGFQLDTRKGSNQIYTPEYGKTYPNKYLFAKMHVTCADAQYHNFVSHLLLTHLAMEPIVVAANHCLSTDHPILCLLKPHFKDTIAINFLARHTLISHILPVTDPEFSVGTGGGLMMCVMRWSKYNFTKESFPEQLKKRGFAEDGSDGLEDYYYRDDGMTLWNILKKYVTSAVDESYKTDQDVEADKELQAFAQMTCVKGQVYGFPFYIDSKGLLVEVLTNTIFTMTAQHAAINFPQWDYGGYLPNRPEMLTKPMPDTEGDMTEKELVEALPGPFPTTLQILLKYALSMPSLTTLTKLTSDQTGNKFGDAHAVLQDELKEQSAVIKERNKQLAEEGKFTYSYLDPEHVPMSIDI
ncbi:ALOX5 [Branchiostoma lanceolatum]|uniref:ALOX5 protein n=1 Tax=Branchiostoma lanceolatum TaxID=7740 RepID=A0A8J9ZZC1_BRALA|nr:ALOX5 [Branchiostoma lanceolatum]